MRTGRKYTAPERQYDGRFPCKLTSPLPTRRTIGRDARHPLHRGMGPVIAVYVWQYPLRLFHWGMVISIAVLSFTGYYIHDPFIVGQVNHPFLMGWFRFVHEAFGMMFIALFLLRIYSVLRGEPLGGLEAVRPAARARSSRKCWT